MYFKDVIYFVFAKDKKYSLKPFRAPIKKIISKVSTSKKRNNLRHSQSKSRLQHHRNSYDRSSDRQAKKEPNAQQSQNISLLHAFKF